MPAHHSLIANGAGSLESGAAAPLPPLPQPSVPISACSVSILDSAPTFVVCMPAEAGLPAPDLELLGRRRDRGVRYFMLGMRETANEAH